MAFLDADIQYGRKSILRRKNAVEFCPEDCPSYQSNTSDESVLFDASTPKY